MNNGPIQLDESGRDIHAELATLRTIGPVARIRLPGGVPGWSVVGHEAAKTVLSDRRFSKDPRLHWTAFAEGRIGEDFPMIGWVMMDNLTTAYGSDHSRLRRLTAQAFTPRRVEGLRPGIEKVVGELIEALARSGTDRPVDLKAEFARPLAVQVICDLFGVPDEDREMVLRGGAANIDTTLTPEEAAANVEQWHQEMHEFVAAKRRSPGDDLTTGLLEAQAEDGSRLSESELVGTLHLMLAAGAEPPTNLLTKAALALLTHPDQREMAVSGRVPWTEVIEETLRVEAPVAHLPFRFAVEDVEVCGVTIPRGEPILMGFAAAGRDPELHGDDAGCFDITRENKEHLAFGHGIYRCIGMPLARLEAELALPALFEALPGMALAVPAEQLEPEATFIMNGLRSLPVDL